MCAGTYLIEAFFQECKHDHVSSGVPPLVPPPAPQTTTESQAVDVLLPCFSYILLSSEAFAFFYSVAWTKHTTEFANVQKHVKNLGQTWKQR